jgi:hypothetical protein
MYSDASNIMWKYSVGRAVCAAFSKMLRKKDDRRKKGELTDEQVNEIKEAFVLFDTDGSGAQARQWH